MYDTTAEVEKKHGIQWQFNDYTLVLHSVTNRSGLWSYAPQETIKP